MPDIKSETPVPKKQLESGATGLGWRETEESRGEGVQGRGWGPGYPTPGRTGRKVERHRD